MPLFGKKKRQETRSNDGSPLHQRNTNNSSSYDADSMSRNSRGNNLPGNDLPSSEKQPKYTFHCQLAHGSPTGIISGFTNVMELYSKISECYDIDASEILFCTLNSHKVDVDKLLGGQIGLDDFIFAHVKGQRKEIDILKSEDALGLTITDNGAGYAFIKRIKPGSVMDRIELVEIGDHIEKIDGENFVGKRHFDVAKRLKEIPKGTAFTIRLVSPEKTPFAQFAPRSIGGGKSGAGISSGKKTLRLRASGKATEEDAPDQMEDTAINAINRLVETILGVDDREMAQSIWEIGKDIDNPHDFSVALDGEMAAFGFPDDLIFDFWGAINDAKSGRLPNQTTGKFPVSFEEHF